METAGRAEVCSEDEGAHSAVTTNPLKESAVMPEQPTSSTTGPGNAAAPELFRLVEQQPFFKGMQARQLQVLADSAMVMNFEAGQVIFQQGSPANRFYLILEGQAVLESELPDQSTIFIQTLGPGDDLGWSWLFPPYSIHLSARALAPTKTIFFYGTRLREQCEQDHELGYQIMSRIAEVTTRCLQSMQGRLMDYADPNKYTKR